MSGLLFNLGIDWRLLIAQAINFAILMWLLNRYAYKPILAVLEKRRSDIKKNADLTDETEKKLKEISILKDEILSKARKDSETIIQEAETSAERVRQEKIKDAESEALHIVTSANARVDDDREKLRLELKEEVADLVITAVEKTVGDVIGKKEQEKMADEAVSFIKSAYASSLYAKTK